MSYKYFPRQENKIDSTNEYVAVIRLSDNALIPIDNDNVDYQEVLKWVEAGNTIAEADE